MHGCGVAPHGFCGVEVDGVKDTSTGMFIRAPVFNAVLLSVLVAEVLAVAITFAAG